jgi:hypothetical protein
VGLSRWEQELSFVGRADMTPEFAKALHATLPHEQIAPKRFGRAASAVQAAPLLAMSSNLVEAARKEGVRVHTVGVDRVSADFYYFAEGGDGEPLRVQGNLLEMLSDRVGSSTSNADIEALQASLISRLLSALSKGAVAELDVELADALPRLSRDGTGLVGTDLEAFEAQAKALATGSAHFEAAARRLVEALVAATRAGQARARVPLYGEAQRETMAPLEVLVMGKPLQLPECFLWTVTGAPSDERAQAPAKAAPRAVATQKRAEVRSAASQVAKTPETQPGVAAPPAPAAKAAEPAKPEVTAPVPAKSEVSASPAAPVTPADRPAELARRSPQAVQSQTRQSTVAKRSPMVPMALLLALAASLYFLWRSLP